MHTTGAILGKKINMRGKQNHTAHHRLAKSKHIWEQQAKTAPEQQHSRKTPHTTMECANTLRTNLRNANPRTIRIPRKEKQQLLAKMREGGNRRSNMVYKETPRRNVSKCIFNSHPGNATYSRLLDE